MTSRARRIVDAAEEGQGRKTRVPKVLRTDPGGSLVDDRVFRMEIPVSLHDVATARQPADVRPRVKEPADHAVLFRFHAPDRRAVEGHPDPDAMAREARDGRRDPRTREGVDRDVEGPLR